MVFSMRKEILFGPIPILFGPIPFSLMDEMIHTQTMRLKIETDAKIEKNTLNGGTPEELESQWLSYSAITFYKDFRPLLMINKIQFYDK